MNKLSEIILEKLVDEDRMCEIDNEDNPIQFFFKKKDYVIHLTNIHSWTQRPHMRRIQISKSLIDSLIKYHRYYIFGIFGYDSKTDILPIGQQIICLVNIIRNHCIPIQNFWIRLR